MGRLCLGCVAKHEAVVQSMLHSNPYLSKSWHDSLKRFEGLIIVFLWLFRIGVLAFYTNEFEKRESYTSGFHMILFERAFGEFDKVHIQ